MVEVFQSYAHNGVSTIPEDAPINDVSRVAAAAVAARVLMGAAPGSSSGTSSPTDTRPMTRGEHAAMMQELTRKRAGWRTPRRGWSSTDTPVGQLAAPYPTPAVPSPALEVAQPQLAEESQPQLHATLDVPQQAARHPVAAPPTTGIRMPSRPAIGTPRRSYSVMECEPSAPTHRLADHMTIFDLPGELHYVIFDFLDPIDSTCLGLTHSHFYEIHRRMHGTIPLSSRRQGPNDLEWAWRGAGPLVRPASTPRPDNKPSNIQEKDASAAQGPERSGTAPGDAKALERLRVKGQVYCRRCGISRCELHRHLKDWMSQSGKQYEYCAVSGKYGPPASGEAQDFCSLRSPKKPHRCARHSARPGSGMQTPVVQEQQVRV